MAKVYDGISDRLAAWLHAQPMYFVGTAPLESDGLVNVSPKGVHGTFAVLDEHTVAYLDLTGSGVETIAHLRQNGRVCVMFCAFEGSPKIVRLHGTGRVLGSHQPGFDAALAPFAETARGRETQSRAVITVEVHRVSDSCGFGVPLMDVRAERDLMDAWAAKKGPEAVLAYRAERNVLSVDRLPGLV